MTRSQDPDAGETLVELIVAVAIMGIGAVAILAGFQLSILTSDVGRKQANSDSVVRTLAEKIQNWVAAGNYIPCAASTSYLNNATTTGMPTGYNTPTATAAQVWTGAAWTSSCSASTDPGVQRIELTVTSPGTGTRIATEKLTMIVRKPCSNPAATAASPTATPC
jgi:type II secretory pathway pseudopilin PulG